MMRNPLPKGKTYPSVETLPPAYRGWLPRALSHMDSGHADEKALELLLQQACWRSEWDRRARYEWARRLVDMTIALIILVVVSPLLALLGMTVMVCTGGYPLYRQLRVGRFGKLFWVYKFRTMRIEDEAQPQGDLPPLIKPKVGRSTSKVTRWLRNHKLDELPQLINIFIGDMSWVGPRPFSMEDAVSIPTHSFQRWAVRPGLTGLAQATLPNDSAPLRRLELDRAYVRNRGWILDLKLVAVTALVVFQGEQRYRGTSLDWFGLATTDPELGGDTIAIRAVK